MDNYHDYYIRSVCYPYQTYFLFGVSYSWKCIKKWTVSLFWQMVLWNFNKSVKKKISNLEMIWQWFVLNMFIFVINRIPRPFNWNNFYTLLIHLMFQTRKFKLPWFQRNGTVYSYNMLKHGLRWILDSNINAQTHDYLIHNKTKTTTTKKKKKKKTFLHETFNTSIESQHTYL